MRLFESDNFWKRRERNRRRAERPDTPAARLADLRAKLVSDCLWLFGAALLVVLGLLGLRFGVVQPGAVTVVFLVTLALYVCISLPSVSKEYQEYRQAKNGQG